MLRMGSRGLAAAVQASRYAYPWAKAAQLGMQANRKGSYMAHETSLLARAGL